MRRSWSENKEQALDYTTQLLDSYSRYPGREAELSPALYREQELQSFVAAFPRQAKIFGRPFRLGLMSFFTVAPGWKGQGYGKAIWVECLHRLQTLGYDGALHYCVHGNVSNFVTAAAVCQAGCSLIELRTVPYLMRILKPAQTSDSPTPPATSDLFLELSSEVQASACRLWTPAEASWQLEQRPGALSMAADQSGLLSGVRMNIADAHNTGCVIFEDILWERLNPENQERLLQAFLTQAIAGGTRVAMAPELGYATLDTFRKSGFRKSTRVLRAYLTVWKEDVADWLRQSITTSGRDLSLYMDVY